MKRWILTVLVMGLLAGVAEAQTESGTSSRTTNDSSPGIKKNKKATKENKAPSQTLNNRKNYNWKDGQKATPTGHEAAPANGSYQSLKEDTATVKKKKRNYSPTVLLTGCLSGRCF